jgi:hypothetical protein
VNGNCANSLISRFDSTFFTPSTSKSEAYTSMSLLFEGSFGVAFSSLSRALSSIRSEFSSLRRVFSSMRRVFFSIYAFSIVACKALESSFSFSRRPTQGV